MKTHFLVKLTTDLLTQHFRLIVGFITLALITGGFGYVGEAYFSSAQMYGLIQSLILQAQIITGQF